jgi:hypothetical protein
MDVESFDCEEGTRFLITVLQRNINDTRELRAARSIASELGGLPLAIVQIAGLIRRRHYSLQHFLEVYNRHTRRVLDSSGRTSDHYHSLSTIWTQTFMGLDGHTLELLLVLSMFDPDQTDVSLLQNALEEMGSDDTVNTIVLVFQLTKPF